MLCFTVQECYVILFYFTKNLANQSDPLQYILTTNRCLSFVFSIGGPEWQMFYVEYAQNIQKEALLIY